jgi:TolB-like protein/DNA-binding winged helix-turn-helix (wHTH) protein
MNDFAPAAIKLTTAEEFAVGGSTLRPRSLELSSPSGTVTLQPRVMQVLLALAHRAGEVVTRDDLIATCWNRRIVSEDAIQRTVFKARKVAESQGEFSIETVRGAGYRLRISTPAPTFPSSPAPTLALAMPRVDRSGTPGPSPLPNAPSIAVMPFENLSGDADQDYFADGMVEEIVTALARFKSIVVIGSGSTLGLKTETLSLDEVGRRLGVQYLLEGSVRRAGGRVRISVRLSNASSGANLLGERFDDTLQDIFALQDRVALHVAAKIEPTIEVVETRRVAALPIEVLGSYELYLRAWALERTFQKAIIF